MVLDSGWRQDEGLGHLCSRQAAPNASSRVVAERAPPARPGWDLWSVIHPSLPGTVTDVRSASTGLGRGAENDASASTAVAIASSA
jgi:hypothetical protein